MSTYDLADFKPYDMEKYILNRVVLVWSKKHGYRFMEPISVVLLEAEGIDYKIIAIKKLPHEMETACD